jgi:hypothetical protein
MIDMDISPGKVESDIGVGKIGITASDYPIKTIEVYYGD